jgi:hypothetical protein
LKACTATLVIYTNFVPGPPSLKLRRAKTAKTTPSVKIQDAP